MSRKKWQSATKRCVVGKIIITKNNQVYCHFIWIISWLRNRSCLWVCVGVIPIESILIGYTTSSSPVRLSATTRQGIVGPMTPRLISGGERYQVAQCSPKTGPAELLDRYHYAYGIRSSPEPYANYLQSEFYLIGLVCCVKPKMREDFKCYSL